MPTFKSFPEPEKFSQICKKARTNPRLPVFSEGVRRPTGGSRRSTSKKGHQTDLLTFAPHDL
jgi:hypothetical protein